MKINFTQILQDSWHFFRNRQKTMFQFVLLLFIVQVLSALFSPALISQESLMEKNSIDLSKVDTTSIFFSFALTQLITTFISAWGLMTIHQISRQNDRTLGQNFQATLPRFVGMIILNLLVMAPILFGVIEMGAAAITQTSASIISLVAFGLGIWFFIRLNLSSVHYLTTQDSLGKSLQTIWQQGRNKKGNLVIYTLLVYFVVPILIFQLSALFNHLFFAVLVSVFAAALNIFMLVFTYRFYRLFMQEA